MNEAGDEFGFALGTAFDVVDGEVFRSLIVGAPGEDDSSGAVFFVPTTTAGLDTEIVIAPAGARVVRQEAFGEASAPGDRFGAAIAPPRVFSARPWAI